MHSGEESDSFQGGYCLVACRIGVHFELVSAVATMREKVEAKINKRDFLLLLWFCFENLY